VGCLISSPIPRYPSGPLEKTGDLIPVTVKTVSITKPTIQGSDDLARLFFGSGLNDDMSFTGRFVKYDFRAPSKKRRRAAAVQNASRAFWVDRGGGVPATLESRGEAGTGQQKTRSANSGF